MNPQLKLQTFSIPPNLTAMFNFLVTQRLIYTPILTFSQTGQTPHRDVFTVAAVVTSPGTLRAVCYISLRACAWHFVKPDATRAWQTVTHLKSTTVAQHGAHHPVKEHRRMIHYDLTGGHQCSNIASETETFNNIINIVTYIWYMYVSSIYIDIFIVTLCLPTFVPFGQQAIM